MYEKQEYKVRGDRCKIREQNIDADDVLRAKREHERTKTENVVSEL